MASIGSLSAWSMSICETIRQNLLLQPSRALPGSLCRIPPMWKACGVRYPLPVLHLPHYSTELDTVHFWLQLEAFLRGACRSVGPVYSKKSVWANMLCCFPAKPVAAAFTGPLWLLVSHPSHVESLGVRYPLPVLHLPHYSTELDTVHFLASIGSLSAWSMSICETILQNLLLQPSRALPGSLCRIPPMWKACGIRCPLPVLHLPHYSTELDTVHFWLQLEAFLRGACRSVRPVYSKKSAWANMFCDFKKSNTFGLYIGLNSTRTWVA